MCVCVTSTGLKDVTGHTEALNFISLHDSNWAISLLNSKISMMRKAVLYNCKVLDTLQHHREMAVLQSKVNAAFSFLIHPLM